MYDYSHVHCTSRRALRSVCSELDAAQFWALVRQHVPEFRPPHVDAAEAEAGAREGEAAGAGTRTPEPGDAAAEKERERKKEKEKAEAEKKEKALKEKDKKDKGDKSSALLDSTRLLDSSVLLYAFSTPELHTHTEEKGIAWDEPMTQSGELLDGQAAALFAGYWARRAEPGVNAARVNEQKMLQRQLGFVPFLSHAVVVHQTRTAPLEPPGPPAPKIPAWKLVRPTRQVLDEVRREREAEEVAARSRHLQCVEVSSPFWHSLTSTAQPPERSQLGTFSELHGGVSVELSTIRSETQLTIQQPLGAAAPTAAALVASANARRRESSAHARKAERSNASPVVARAESAQRATPPTQYTVALDRQHAGEIVPDPLSGAVAPRPKSAARSAGASRTGSRAGSAPGVLSLCLCLASFRGRFGDAAVNRTELVCERSSSWIRGARGVREAAADQQRARAPRVAQRGRAAAELRVRLCRCRCSCTCSCACVLLVLKMCSGVRVQHADALLQAELVRVLAADHGPQGTRGRPRLTLPVQTLHVHARICSMTSVQLDTRACTLVSLVHLFTCSLVTDQHACAEQRRQEGRRAACLRMPLPCCSCVHRPHAFTT